MYEDDVTSNWFLFLWYLHNLVFSRKNFFAHVGFCAPEMPTKFWDFAAGMDFDTK